VQIESVSPSPTRESVDPIFGNGLFYWLKGSEPAPGGSLDFEIRFSLTAYETVTDIDPELVQKYREDDANFDLYTKSERFIEATNPQIIELADQIAGGETNPYVLARKYYDYVVDHARYKLLGEGLKGAVALVETDVGECGDYVSLFIALCRAAGIPSRPIVGYWAISGIDQTHVWAEFYLEPFGWIPVDPTIGQQKPSQRDYYFGNMDNQRVILNKGFNLMLDPPGPDNYVAPFLQVPLWWFWGNGNAAGTYLERTTWKVVKIP
jgi:transglutaminase-like putative cysteine protease